MQPDLQQIVGDYEAFLRLILNKISAVGFDMHDFVQLDHMCYRTVSAENYEAKKTALKAVATMIDETVVSGRPIAVFRLRLPIVSQDWRIDVLELPAPKPDKPYLEGLEHIEFVIYDSQKVFLQKYADKTFNLVSINRGINPEIGFTLDERHAVKFHLLSLPTAVYLQNKLGITEV